MNGDFTSESERSAWLTSRTRSDAVDYDAVGTEAQFLRAIQLQGSQDVTLYLPSSAEDGLVLDHRVILPADLFAIIQLITVGGNGWDYGNVKAQVKALGLENRVHFLGYVSDDLLRLLYRKALVFVYPSLFEGFGLTVLEAMASGCPVITSNISSMPEISGDAAILINPEDVDELSANLELVSTNKKIREHMIIKGLQRAKTFTWKRAAKLTNNIYLKIIDSSFKNRNSHK